MNFPLLNILKEIQEQLNPVLSDLGLKAKIGTKSFNATYAPHERGYDPSLHISFVDPKGRFFSPVEIDVTKLDEKGQRRPSFEGWTMRTFSWVETALGDSGWRLFDNERFFTKALGGEKGSIYETIEAELRRAGVVPDAGKNKRITTSALFGELYRVVEDTMYLFDDTKVLCERHGEVESCSFRHDVDASEWRVALEGKEAVLYVDGQRKESCAANNGSGVMGILSRGRIEYLPRRTSSRFG